VGGPPGWPPEAAWILGYQECLWPASPARHHLAGSYDGDFVGLTPRPIPSLSSLLASSPADQVVRIWRLGAVDYVTSLYEIEFPGVREVAAVPSSVYSVPIRLYRVEDTLPRAYVVGRARVVPDMLDAARTALEPAFNPRSAVVLSSGKESLADSDFSGTAEIVSRRSGEVVIDTQTSADGYAVLVESFVPAWRATVDGVPAAVVRANGAFRAVAVPAGRHRIVMTYWPATIPIGIALCASAVLLSIFALAKSRRSAAA
jgi:hypothetical protein